MRFFRREKTVWRVVFSFLLLGMSFLSACTSGPMEVDELYYLRSTNGENTNYYRIRVKGNTQVSKADFRQGWFPSDAVDALFGDINEETAGESIATKEEIRKQINKALVETNRGYLNSVKNVNGSGGEDQYNKNIDKWMKAQALVRLTPQVDMAYNDKRHKGNTRIMEYYPKRDLITQRDGQKLVFILSANPDEIINDISSFASEEQTEALIHKLTGKLVKGEEQRVVTLAAESDFQDKADKLIADQLTSTKTDLKPDAQRQWVINRLNDLISLIESVTEETKNEK